MRGNDHHFSFGPESFRHLAGLSQAHPRRGGEGASLYESTLRGDVRCSPTWGLRLFLVHRECLAAFDAGRCGG